MSVFEYVLKDSGLFTNIVQKNVVYIAGPFASDPQENTDNAIKLGRIATYKGYAPIIPHTTIISGAYGRDEIPQEREDGMLVTLSILNMIAQDPKSQLWLIESEDGSLSSGTQLEWELWLATREYLSFPINTTRKTYREWVSYLAD